ncbi:MAG: SDR family NAD(P)-dependent oxidoreductase [Kiritimatiellae bacterium]|nr:SDR family NAD(P)-dependent oxidoreductase [Kiritimatiellia bacterium]
MNIVITGASSGIGEALAIECAKRGDRLFLCGRNAQRLENTAEKCRALGAATDAETIDVTDSEAVAQWLTQCENKAPIERVFANAGVSTGEETSDNVRRTFATNVGGVVNTVLPAIEIFRNGQERTTKQIVITSSIAGYGPLKACPSYSATKSCVKTWGLALRGMLAPEGIAVSVICPGFIRSRITDANTCPMPFFMEADKAASIILKRADKNKGMISFPWPMRLSTWFLSIMPQFLNELINKLLPKKII